ncbi:MAG: YjbQ family protein [Actinomycetota bacterium]|nr:YjbQ family protein [Actinomycetota bacterium]
MRTSSFSIDTRGQQVVEITERVIAFAREVGGDGLLSVFVPHATCGLALIETGSGSEEDLIDAIERLLPRDDRYGHGHGSRGHGADHLLPAFVSSSLLLPVQAGGVVLGTWQRVVVVDTNRENNTRSVLLSFLTG